MMQQPGGVIRFPRWRPDLAPINGGGLTIINALPKADGYAAAVGPVVVAPDALVDKPLLLVAARASDGTTTPLAFCSTRTYRSTLTAWIPCDGSVMSSHSWDAVIYGDTMYAVNGGPAPLQKVDLLSGASFSPVDVPNGMTGRSIAIVADFLMLFYIVEISGTRRWPFRAQWSGIQRPESFIPSKQLQSDFQDFNDIGELMKGTGGEFGMVLGSKGLARMDYIGAPDIFKITTLENNIGCEFANTVIRSGDKVVWWSKLGWRMSSGGPSVAIGNDKCDRWFRERINRAGADNISTTILPDEEIAVWSFPTLNSGSGEPDELLYYDFNANEFSMGRSALQIIGSSVQGSPLTDDPTQPPDNLPSDEVLTDSYPNLLTDGFGDNQSFPAAIVGGRLCRLDRGALPAVFRTQETRFGAPGQKSTLLRFASLVHGAEPAVARVLTREQQGEEAYQEGPDLHPLKGRYKTRRKAHYHVVELTQPGNFQRAVGIEVIEVVTGMGS